MSNSVQNLKKINLQIAITFFSLIIFIISILLYFNHTFYKETLLSSQKLLNKSLVNILQISIDRISFSGRYHAQIFADSLLEKEKDLLFINIITEDNKKIAFAKQKDFELEAQYDYSSFHEFINLNLDKTSNKDDQNYVYRFIQCCGGEEYYEVALPFLANFDHSKKGVIIVGISNFNVSKKLRENVLFSLIIGAFASLLGLTIAFQLAQKISMPINNLAQTFAGVLNHAPVNIVIRKPNGEIIEASENYKNIFNREFKTNLNRKSYLNQWKYAFKEIDEFLRVNGSITKKEYHFIDGDLDEYFTTISFKISQKNSNEDSYCTIAINTSDENKFRKELESKTNEAKKASEAKTSFLATMSHEIRTPLTSILGFLGLLEESVLSEKQEKYVRTALGASENLMALINDILDYSKIESNDFKLEYKFISLNELLTDIQGIFEHQIREKNLSFDLLIDSQIHDHIEADLLRMRQILINLIGNAIKFTSQGKITLQLQFLARESDYQSIRFNIIDTGIGISNVQISHIFDEFTQADNSISRRFGGTGLGLSITKKLIALMGGAIHVKSEVNKGSNFYFDLNFKVNEEAIKTRSQIKKENMNEEDFKNKKILVVDDEESNRQLINLFLTKYGIKIDFCDNGRDAIEMVIENEYDLVLMDIQMPEIDGVQAIKAIREQEKLLEKKESRVFAFTANVFKEQLDEYRAHGFNGHLLKPFKKSELIEFIAQNLV